MAWLLGAFGSSPRAAADDETRGSSCRACVGTAHEATDALDPGLKVLARQLHFFCTLATSSRVRERWRG